MTRGPLRLLWGLALALLLAAGWRATQLANPYRAGAPVGPIEDRREHHFRNLTQSQTQRLFDSLLLAATQASGPAIRARYLARIAALQRERGLGEAAEAAAREALRAAPNDPEVRRILSAPLELESRP